MEKQDKVPKKNRKKPTKNDLPILDSDQDLLSAFMDSPLKTETKEERNTSQQARESYTLNKHGMPILDEFEGAFLQGEKNSGERESLGSEGPEDLQELEEEENFELLLEASLKEKKGPYKKKRIPMPIKKRLKRYPPPEAELDLHGFTALGAELKAKAFISTCKHQGYFSLRLIVGRGLHSDLGPVLPDVIEDLVKVLEKQNIVLSHKWDQQKKSKSGSLIVYIKQFSD
jgi:DNA-nicking Smr family endonuclease